MAATFVNRRSGVVVAQDRGDILVGADGIHSEVRRRFYPDEGPPRYAGQMLWRGVTEVAPFLTGRSMIMAGHAGQKFVAYPICSRAATYGRSLINWVAERKVDGADLTRQDWNRRVEKSEFAPAFASWRFDWLDVPALIDGAAAHAIFPSILPQWSNMASSQNRFILHDSTPMLVGLPTANSSHQYTSSGAAAFTSLMRTSVRRMSPAPATTSRAIAAAFPLAEWKRTSTFPISSPLVGSERDASESG